VFLPERLELVRGAPAGRRAHLDRFVAALWPARGLTRASYSQALGQRNAALARVRRGASPSLLDPWDAELARLALELMDARTEAANLVAPGFAGRAAELGLPERAELVYAPRSRALDPGQLLEELLERRPGDLERGFTAHGPHRDELVIRHGGRLLRSYGSQGQQRVGLLALLFAERDVLLERGSAPLMLLDDVTSELDATRRECLAELVRAGGQAVISATELEHVPGWIERDVIHVEVEEGKLRARSPAPLASVA
ncbi:MAG: DNA replication and repair protein RecF, partial [Thermoleophilaceae bacterium]|nr:DNA replication and repair protein RecF [Thermoleophilaceae bacterium]